MSYYKVRCWAALKRSIYKLALNQNSINCLNAIELPLWLSQDVIYKQLSLSQQYYCLNVSNYQNIPAIYYIIVKLNI